ncbi:tetratricopeptide repeat protein [bacterium]|nr:tetratricopeptide repeat protein [bacterium]MCI0603229.1 tetratricopeptide repeat protein [bacterium]
MMRAFLTLFVLIALTLAQNLSADPLHSDASFDATVAQANELFLAADFDAGIALIQEMEKTRPNSPAVSYFLANGYWWKIFRAYIYETETKETPYDQLFELYLAQTIEQSERLLKQNRSDVTALFYLGNAYSLKSRVKGLRGSYFSAGRDAAKGKKYLERILELHPKQYDTYYNIGVYNYMAGALPGYAKVLKTLLFLPGGNKEKGLNYLNIASKKSMYFGAEAELILARFHADFEDQPLEAIAVVKRFHEKYPNNAWYNYWLGTLYLDEVSDYQTAEKIFMDVLERCQRGIPTYTKEVRNQARLKLARVHSRQLAPEKAIEEIKTLIAEKPKEPTWILVRAHMELASIYDQIGMRNEAIHSYTQVLSLPEYRHSHGDAEKLRSQKYNQTLANIYRLNLEGRRLAAQGKFVEAESSFQAILKRYPNSVQTLYYMAEMYYLKEDYPRAEKLYKDLLKRNPREPEGLIAGIYVKLGQIYEARKLKLAAKHSYEKALINKFIAADDRNAARKGLRQVANKS